MKNYVGPGNVITLLAATAAVTAGQGVVVGSHLGVANSDAAAGEPVDVTLTGAYTVAKVAGAAFAPGQPLMWDASAKAFAAVGTAASGDVTGVATAFEAAAAGDTVAVVRFSGAPGVVAA